MVLILVLQALSCAVAEPSDEYTGGAFIPAVTADGHYPDVTVTYSYTISLERDSPPRNLATEDTLETIRENTDAIIVLRIQTYLSRRIAEMKMTELSEIIDDSPAANQLSEELAKVLSDTSALDNVEIRDITLDYE